MDRPLRFVMIILVITIVSLTLVYLGMRLWWVLLTIGIKVNTEQSRINNRALADHLGVERLPEGEDIIYTNFERLLMKIFRIKRP